jgi:glycerol-3-phosphate cytidylyltransferase
MDKMKAWQNLRFDALFHGDDWKNTTLYDNYIDQFRQVGVDVVFLPHTQGTSSTEVAARLHER